jgi:hypothetical protein
LYHSQVEFCSNGQGRVFPPKNFSNSSPSGACLPELGADGLGIVVVLRHHPSEVFVYLNSLEYITVYCILLAEGQRCCDCRFPLSSSLRPDLTLFR